MLFIYFRFVLISYVNLMSIIIAENNITTVLIEYITRFKTHQIIIFADNQNNYSLREKMISDNILMKKPTMIIDSKDLQLFNEYNKTTIAKNHRIQSKLLIIFQQVFQLQEVESVFNFYIKLVPLQMRPNCLIIFNDLFINNSLIYKSLKNSWNKQFVDTSMLNL